MVWIQFVGCTVLLVIAARLLSKSGDVLAEKTGLGRTWVGAILLAGATSLPELVSGGSAIIFFDSPNLAAGAIFGSCLFNLGLLAVMDLLYQPGSILSSVQEGHLLSAGLGVLMIAIASLSIVLPAQLVGPAVLGIGATTVVLVLVYLVGARLLFRFEKRRQAEFHAQCAAELEYANISRRRALVTFCASALVVFGLGAWLASISDQIAATTGLASSFVGNLFLATATSLPEVVVCITAVRMGAIDLAVGNVLGSNVFNLLILATYDLMDLRGNMWAQLAPTHAMAGMLGIIMTSIVVISLVYRASPKTPYRVQWDGVSLLLVFLGSMIALYLTSGAV